jgi:hypothetical protein
VPKKADLWVSPLDFLLKDITIDAPISRAEVMRQRSVICRSSCSEAGRSGGRTDPYRRLAMKSLPAVIISPVVVAAAGYAGGGEG